MRGRRYSWWMVALTVSACGGGGGGGGTPVPVPTTVTISGRVTFEKIPGNASGVGLDYAAKADAPARDVLVEAVKVSDRTTVSASASTDASGNYSLTVPSNTDLFLRAKAEMVKTGTPAWHFRVLDNTASNALYAITGADFNSGVAASQRNLNAASGWGGSSYTGTRAAAPFAILDTVYQAYSLVLTANATASFPDLELYWSKNNRPEYLNGSFDGASGAIGTTAFSAANPANGTLANIYILGAENVDTDEYDASVIAHEWGHYFQASFSRDDSIGGSHAADDLLDLRVAFSEGWGDSFSGMATGSSVYQDSQFSGQASGSCLGLESNTSPASCASTANPGWYSELSITHVLYDFFDSNADGVDTVSLGFTPIYDVMTHEMITTHAMTSIYPFAAALKSRNASSAVGINQILGAEHIAATAPNFDDYGTGENNDAGIASVLPVYIPIALGAAVSNVCSDTPFGPLNKLGVSKFLAFTLPSALTVTISATGPSASDPDFRIYSSGSQIALAESTVSGQETLTQSLAAGDYVVELYEFTNYSTSASVPLGKTCFTVSIN